MNSNKKSFWDLLGETLSSLYSFIVFFISILFIVGLIANIIDFFKDINNGDKTKLLKLGVWICLIFSIWYLFHTTALENHEPSNEDLYLQNKYF